MSAQDTTLMAEDYQTVTPLITFKNSSDAIDYYKKVFDAKERYRLEEKDKIIYAEIMIGKSIIMIMDEDPKMASGTTTVGNTAVNLYVYVKNVDETFNKAIEMGAKVDSPVETQFYGDRVGMITDPFGYKWSIATRIKTLSAVEIKTNLKNMVNKMDKPKLSGGKRYEEKSLKYKPKIY